MLNYLEGELVKTPLELLAQAVSRPAVPETTAQKLFDSYDAFLGVLDDERRQSLEQSNPGEMGASPVWQEIRNLSNQFQLGLNELFYSSDEELRNLIVSYGVF